MLVSDYPLVTPVAFLIFNRPDVTRRVFAEIARARPSRLLVVADGARTPDEEPRCAAARAVIDGVDWPCDVQTNYSDVNLGCGHRVATGLDWVFQECDEAIILEDDCLPDQTFFPFCQELLHKYRNNEDIQQITGGNYLLGKEKVQESYYFSRHAHVWGWASWRRAWTRYDFKMESWPARRETTWPAGIFPDEEARYWRACFEQVASGKVDTWDHQWLYTALTHDALTIVPRVNLISNLGIGSDATHTFWDSPFANLPRQQMEFPLRHPLEVKPNRSADRRTYRTRFWIPPVPLRTRIRTRLSPLYQQYIKPIFLKHR